MRPRERDIEPAPAAWTRTRLAAFALFVASSLASLAWIAHPWFDLSVDASIYLLTTESLLAGDGYTYLGEPFSIRPPGFSVLIAPLLATYGTDFRALNLFIGVWGVAGVVLLLWYQRARLGFWLALLVALAVWWNPGYQRLSTQTMSDVPGAALLLACLLVERWARAARSVRRDLVLGLCIGLSSYVRSLLILLVPAILLSRLLLRDRAFDASWRRFAARRMLPLAAVALLALAPWSLRNRLEASAAPAEQTRLHSYRVALLHVDPADPGSPLLGPSEILARVPLRMHQVMSVLGSRMRNDYVGKGDPAGEFQPAHAGLALCALGGAAIALWRRREPAELFVFGSLAVIVTYFGFGGRLLLPVHLLAFPAAVEVARDAVARRAGARAGGVAAGALVLLLLGFDAGPRRDLYEIEREHRTHAELGRSVASAVGPDVRLAAPIGANYSVFLGRPVYNLEYAALHNRPIAAVDRVIERHRVGAVVLPSWTPHDDRLASHLRGRYGPPERAGLALLWRIPGASVN